jgi:hypothetical protein
MLKRIVLAALAALIFATPVLAHFPHGGVSGGSSPVVVAGSTQPAYDAAGSTSSNLLLTNVVVNDVTPTYHGSSGDPNYNSRTFGRWDNPAFMLMSGTFKVGLFAHHPPTNTELKSGLDSNVSSVQVRCDGGSWYTISAPSANASAGGTVDWNFTVNDTAWADGLHKCDAVMIPTTGPDGIMNGPPITAGGTNADEMQSVDKMIIDSGTRGVAGNVLTVPSTATFLNSRSVSATGVLGVGWSVSAYRVAAGTFIDGDNTHGNTNCGGGAGSCTGTGGAGTYHLTGPAQTVYGSVGTGSISNTAGGAGTILSMTAISSGGLILPAVFGTGVTGSPVVDADNNQNNTLCTSQAGSPCTANSLTGTYHVTGSNQNVASTTIYASAPATFGNERSFYFLTNHGGTLARATKFVCQGTCGGVTGSDSNGGTSAAPYATIAKAINAGSATDPTTFFKGKWGETICLMNPGSNITYSGTVTLNLAAYLGYVDFVSAKDAMCGLATDPGGEVIVNDALSPNYWANPGHVAWHNLTFFGKANAGNTHDSQYLFADRITQKVGPYGSGELIGQGAWWCVESETWFGANAACPGADMIRNVVGKYAQTDALHDVHSAVGNTVDGGGGDPTTWMSVQYSTGNQLVVTNVTMPAEITAAGNTLTSLFVGSGQVVGPVPGYGDTGCMRAGGFHFSGTVTSATSNTLTFRNDGQVDSGECTNGQNVMAYTGDGSHVDQIQLSKLSYAFFDVFYVGNTINANYHSSGQAPFIQAGLLDGVLFKNNTYNKDVADVELADAVTGGNNNFTYSGNVTNNSGAFLHNQTIGSNAETFFKDKCNAGGTILPPTVAGTNQQALAATSNACYTTSP